MESLTNMAKKTSLERYIDRMHEGDDVRCSTCENLEENRAEYPDGAVFSIMRCSIMFLEGLNDDRAFPELQCCDRFSRADQR